MTVHTSTNMPHPLAGDPIEMLTFGPLGEKKDSDKPPMDLLDPYALEQVARVLGFGAEKYARNNWRKGINVSRLIAACYRHLGAINSGEDLDEETGLQHAAHLMCEAMFIVWMIKNRPDMDDRWSAVANVTD